MNHLEVATILDMLREKGVRAFKCPDFEVEFLADGPQPGTDATAGGETDFERELSERTEGYEVALAQVAKRRFHKQGEA